MSHSNDFPEKRPADRGHDDRDLPQEMLELYFGCHPDPEALRRRIAEDPAKQALYQEVAKQAEGLTRAARAEGPAHPPVLDPQHGPEPAAGLEARGWWGSAWGRWLAVAAAVLVVGLGFTAHAAWTRSQARAFGEDNLRVIVSAPRDLMHGATSTFSVQTTDLRGNVAAVPARWELRRDGQRIADGALAETGDTEGRRILRWEVGETIPDEFRVVVEGRERVETHTLRLDPMVTQPILHVTTDKPVYRPGDVVRLRCVALDRVTLEPLGRGWPLGSGWPHESGWPAGAGFANAIRVDLRDPSGTDQQQVYAQALGVDPSTSDVDATGDPSTRTQAASGVWQAEFVLSPMAPGGRWKLAAHAPGARATDEDRRVEVPLHVTRSQAPRLAKRLRLDRESYAPGETVRARLAVQRLGGGSVAGASVTGKVIVGGQAVADGEGTVDGAGAVDLAFDLPGELAGSAGRVVLTVRDDAVVESAMETFALPLQRIDVQVYPEGGDLVAGVSQRTYVEITDPDGRPVDAEGRIVDDRGETVAAFATVHQGRGRVAFRPAAGRAYRLVLDGPVPTERALPTPRVGGVALAVDPVADADHLSVTVHGPPGVPRLVAAYCRGAMVGQTTVLPGGAPTLDLPIAAEAIGVLRVTVFEPDEGGGAGLVPVAERLVHRLPRDRWQVDVAPGAQGFDELGTAERQEMTVRAVRSDGQKGRALLGVRVYDRSLQDLAGDRLGSLEDRALLLADVERPEDLESFFVGVADDGSLGEGASAERVDLLLGTRGWRRFAWRDLAGDESEAFLAALDPARRQVASRASPATMPQVVDNMASLRPGYRSRTDAAGRAEARERAAWWLGLLALGLLAGLELLRVLAARWMPRARPWAHWTSAGTGVALAAGACLLVPGLLGGTAFHSADDAMVLQMAPSAAAPWTVGEDVLVDYGFSYIRDFDVEVAGGAAIDPVFFRGFSSGAVRSTTVDAIDLPADRLFDLEVGAFLDELVVEEAELAQVDALRERTVVAPRIYAHRANRDADARSDFEECLYWNALLVTDEDGVASFGFDTSDRLTTWAVEVDAHGGGLLGRGIATFDTLQALEMDLVVPVEVTQGDELLLPVGITARSPDAIAAGEVRLAAVGGGSLSARSESGNARLDVTEPLVGGKARVRIPVSVAQGESGGLRIVAAAGSRADRLEREIRVVPRGFPVQWGRGGVLADGRAGFDVAIPDEPVAGSLSATLRLFPSPLGMIQQGLAGLVRQPGGCFEQTSSSNYPNILVLGLLDGHGEAQNPAAALARQYLPAAYDRLVGFASPSGGFEWFGGDPGHVALTAYGLMQFRDMAKVWGGVDATMMAETQAWILGKRDGQGGFSRDREGHSFGQAPAPVVSAYVTWALLHGGDRVAALADTLDRELRVRAERAMETEDGYELALCAAALAEAQHPQAGAALQRLVERQESDGGLSGSTRSITCSRGDDLRVEATAIALLGWLRAAENGGSDPSAVDREPVRRAMEFLVAQQRGNGTFGATQGTILALKALTAYSAATASLPADGACSVLVDGEEVARLRFAAEQTAAAELDLAPFLAGGVRRVELVSKNGRTDMPWAFDLAYHAEVPADDPTADLAFDVGLRETRVDEGETVALDVALEARGTQDEGMVTAVVGLPAGLVAVQEVLDDLQREGRFDFVEVRGRELHFYWRYLEPGQKVAFTVDLLARIPGRTTGPASRAWIYYQPDRIRWVDPLAVEVR